MGWGSWEFGVVCYIYFFLLLERVSEALRWADIGAGGRAGLVYKVWDVQAQMIRYYEQPMTDSNINDQPSRCVPPFDRLNRQVCI